MVDLNTLIPNDANLVLMSAVAINDKGQILALGSRNHDLANDRATKLDQHAHAGATRAFLLTPQQEGAGGSPAPSWSFSCYSAGAGYCGSFSLASVELLTTSSPNSSEGDT